MTDRRTIKGQLPLDGSQELRMIETIGGTCVTVYSYRGFFHVATAIDDCDHMTVKKFSTYPPALEYAESLAAGMDAEYFDE